MPTQPASWQALSPEQDLEQFEARLATAPAQLGGLDTSEPAALFPDDTQAADIGEDDEEAFDPIMSAAQELEALRSVLDAREEEIKSLRQQLAPLLGLPLAVSTREAERDRLARRLAEREAEIARLQARMMREAVPVSSPSQSSAAPAAEHETPAEQRLSAEQASRRSGDSPASAGRARSTIVERAAIEPELAPFSANRERTGRLAEQPPTLHSEVPLEDLLNDIRSLDRASDPGRENTAGTSDVAPTLPPPRQGSDLARPPVQEPKTDRSHDVVERDPLTGDAWPDSVAVRQWQEAQTSENPGEPEPPALPPGDHAFADEGGSAHSEPGDAAGAGEDFGNGEPEDSDLDLSESNPGSDDTNVPGRADDSSSNKPRQTPAPGRKDSGIAAAPVMPGIPRQYSLAPERIDDLKRIVGIGPVIERMLNRLGVYQLRQIAAWNADDIEFFDAQLEEFRGRIRRDHWVDQALELSQAQRR
ncbi:MAG: hypothetical protein R3E83_05325 [Burkholderiaceae bacterium]